MNIIAMIPARYAATRFPAKMLTPLGNKPVIVHTYQNVVATQLFNQVWVVTDHESIYNEIKKIGGHVIMSTQNHTSGSDRIAEAINHLDIDVVINIQGDEPFIQKEPLQKLIQLFSDSTVQVASLMRKIETIQETKNPNCVKVVVDKNNNALYFSRSPIPYNAHTALPINCFAHIGVYGYKKNTLLQFTHWQPTPLEQLEKLEQLRYLENNIPIKMALVNFKNISIDTPEDLIQAEKYLQMLNSGNS